MNTPYTLPCGVELPNRLCKPAMSEQLGLRTGCPSDDLINLYRVWGEQGGAGLLITGNVMVDHRRLTEPRNAVLEDDKDLASYKKMAEGAKCKGSIVIMQISHPGRVGMLPLMEPVGPSAVAVDIPLARFRKPRALTVPEIEEVIQRFATTADLAMKAGFDGVQIHGAHGYLLSQFLSPIANIRTDAWGGDNKRRMALLLAVVHEVRKRIGSKAVLSVKLNSADFQKGGFSQEDSLEVIVELEKAGVDLLEISGGNYESPAMTGVVKVSTQKREAYFVEFAAQVRERSKIPLMLTGGVRSLEFANQVIQNKEVDIVGIARPFAIVPDAGVRFLRGEPLSELPQLKRTGIKYIDAYLQVAFYTLLLVETSRGKPADVPSLNPWMVLLRSALSVSMKAATQFPENDIRWVAFFTVMMVLIIGRMRL